MGRPAMEREQLQAVGALSFGGGHAGFAGPGHENADPGPPSRSALRRTSRPKIGAQLSLSHFANYQN